MSWLSARAICSEQAPDLKKLVPLTKALRYQILRILFRSDSIDHQEKEKLLKLEMADNFSDFDTVQQQACLAADSNLEAKEKLWTHYVTNGDKYFASMLHAGASLAPFYNMDDPKSIEHFGDKFFDQVEHVFATTHRDYAEKFFVNLSPAFLYRPEYMSRYEQILERVK